MKFHEWQGPIPTDTDLEESDAMSSMLPGEQPRNMRRMGQGGAIATGGSYDVAVDSKNQVWYTQQAYGILVRLDPKTGEQKKFKFPGVPSSRGVVVDSKDNIWYSDWDGHKIVKFDQKTEQAKMYQPPTEFASPYGMVFDKNGNLWYADFTGNHITRFDPQTEKFDEFPIPSHNALPRFIAADDQGRIWFCEWWANKVGVLIPSGGDKRVVKSSGPVASSVQ
jgi:streptogramin lyase